MVCLKWRTLHGCFSPQTFFRETILNVLSWPELSFIWFALPTCIICEGVSGFVTDCPCSVWCHGLTTCPCISVHHLAKVRLLIWYKGEYFWLYISFCFFTYIDIYKHLSNLFCLILSFWITFKLIEVLCTSIFLTFSNCQRNLHSLFDSIKG